MDGTDSLAAAKAAYQAYARGDVDSAGAIFAEDCEIFGPLAGGTFQPARWTGPGGFRAYIAQIVAEWSHQTYHLMRIDAEGEWVTALIHVVSMHRRTGRILDATAAHALRFKHGKCVEFHEHIDRASLMKAAGAI